MKDFLNSIGGRKFTLLFICLILVALKDQIGIDDEAINKLVILAVGGSGAIALEDGLSNLGNGSKKAKK